MKMFGELEVKTWYAWVAGRKAWWSRRTVAKRYTGPLVIMVDLVDNDLISSTATVFPSNQVLLSATQAQNHLLIANPVGKPLSQMVRG